MVGLGRGTNPWQSEISMIPKEMDKKIFIIKT